MWCICWVSCMSCIFVCMLLCAFCFCFFLHAQFFPPPSLHRHMLLGYMWTIVSVCVCIYMHIATLFSHSHIHPLSFSYTFIPSHFTHTVSIWVGSHSYTRNCEWFEPGTSCRWGSWCFFLEGGVVWCFYCCVLLLGYCCCL